MGMPATGKSFTANNADLCRFTEDGRICEHWGVFDVASMMRQLGVGAAA
jgi:predicted ester cyclase